MQLCIKIELYGSFGIMQWIGTLVGLDLLLHSLLLIRCLHYSIIHLHCVPTL